MSLSDKPPNRARRPTTTTMISLGDIEEEELLHLSSSVSTESSDEDEQRILSRCGRGSLAGFGSRSANGFKSFSSDLPAQTTRNEPKIDAVWRTQSSSRPSPNNATPRCVLFSDLIEEESMMMNEADPPSLSLSPKRSTSKLTLSRSHSWMAASASSQRSRERLPFNNDSPRQLAKPFASKPQPDPHNGNSGEKRSATRATGFANGLARKSSNYPSFIDSPSGRFSGGPKSSEECSPS